MKKTVIAAMAAGLVVAPTPLLVTTAPVAGAWCIPWVPASCYVYPQMPQMPQFHPQMPQVPQFHPAPAQVPQYHPPAQAPRSLHAMLPAATPVDAPRRLGRLWRSR